MDAFSRSLAAAALVDGQHFTLPGFGTIEGVYISARIDHGARQVEAPRLEVRWSTSEDETAQTFSELLVSTGATTNEAAEIEGNWLDALAKGEHIEVGDLGTLRPNTEDGTCDFEPNVDALAAAFSGSVTIPLEPISKRTLPQTPVAPVVAIDTKKHSSASAKTDPSFIRKLVPYVSAAAVVLLGVMAINFFSRSPALDENLGKAVTVNQDRLNRSPREEATTADLPVQSIEEATPSDIIAGEPSYADNGATSAPQDFTSAITSSEKDAPVADPVSPNAEANQGIPSFDPASLAGQNEDEVLFALSEIDIVIVLGSFGNSKNAARLTEEIAAAGLIPYVDQPGDLTRVGATFIVSSEAEIEAVKARMRKEFNPNAWVLE